MSGVFQGGRHACLKFYYHMYGNDIANLTVFAADASHMDSTHPSHVIWSKNRSQGNPWKEAWVDVYMENDYKVNVFLSWFSALKHF